MATQRETADDAFIRACLEFDDMLARLRAMREDHFGVIAEFGPDWGDVGGVHIVNDKLRAALAIYNMEEESL